MNYNNFDEVFTYEHLLRSADLCKRNVNWKASVQNFMLEKEYNVSVIHNELLSGEFRIKHNHEFDTIERGKKRHIQSVHIRERIVQRCLCDYCLTPLLEPTFCYDNCASQKGKGVDFAIGRVKRHIQKFYREHGTDGYVLLYDYSDYFGSIDHDIIMSMAQKYVTDDRLLNLIRMFVDMSPQGLGLGSQVSQVLSLFAASPIDHMIKDKLHFKYFVRYMDDGWVLHHDKQELQDLLSKIETESAKYKLALSEKKTRIVSLKHFRFLKKRFSLTDSGKIIVKLAPSSIVRTRRKLKKFPKLCAKGRMKLSHVETSYKSWRGCALNYDAYNTVQRMDKYYEDTINQIKNQGGEKNE